MSLYESKEEKKKRRAQDEEKLKEQGARIVAMMAECFSTEAGKFTLNYLMNFCGHGSSPSVFHGVTGEYIPGSSAFNDGKAQVYRHIRSILKDKCPQLLQETEFKTYK